MTSLPTVLSELAPVYTSLHEAKVKKEMTFEQIAKAIDRSEWYTAAIFYGQAKPEDKDIKSLAKVMDVPEELLQNSLGKSFFPHRGLGEWPPKGKSFPFQKPLHAF
jgi:cyanate lyase